MPGADGHGRIAGEFVEVGIPAGRPGIGGRLPGSGRWLHITVLHPFLPPIAAGWARPGGLSHSVVDPFRRARPED